MDRESTQKLRFDRRLIRRRGWISEEKLQSELDALPDVSAKIKPPEEDDEPGSPETPPGA